MIGWQLPTGALVMALAAAGFMRLEVMGLRGDVADLEGDIAKLRGALTDCRAAANIISDDKESDNAIDPDDLPDFDALPAGVRGFD